MEALYYATDKTPKILLDPDTLKFAFQPIFSAKTGEIFGYEGLMRPANCTPKELIDAFINTPFEGGRHQRRVDKVMEIENS